MKHAIRTPLMQFRPRPLSLALALALAAWSLPSSAQEVPISQLPLTVNGGGTIAPNLFYIHDDSSSMNDIIRYDPNVTYAPPWGYINGVFRQLPDADYSHAWEDGYRAGPVQQSQGNVNLATQNAVVVSDVAGWINGSNYTEHILPYTGQCKNLSDDAQKRNCANWYSYYRTRMFTSKAGISTAFANLNSSIRVAYGSIGHDNSFAEGNTDAPTVLARGVRVFQDFSNDPRHGSNKYKKDFYDWLFRISQTPVGTPLHHALHVAGEYYRNQAEPWQDDPGSSHPQAGATISCRKNFTLLMTDGQWNQTVWAPKGIGNADGMASAAIAGVDSKGASATYAYAGDEMLPFQDSFGNNDLSTLADIAMHYWKTDLRPDLDNNLPPSQDPSDPHVGPRDPAFWQHMTTFTVGLRVNFGPGDGPSREEAFAAADAIQKRQPATAWKNPITATETSNIRVADLLHAGVNGHGDFLVAQEPADFQDAISQMLTQADAGVVHGSVGAMSSSSPALTTDTRLYVTSFDSNDWSGKLEAYRLCTRADVAANTAPCLKNDLGKRASVVWTARLPMTGAGGVDGGRRNILTWNQATSSRPESGAEFRIPRPPLADDVVRAVRNHPLGDIINSGVLYINPGVKDYGWLHAGSLNSLQRESYLQRMWKAMSLGAANKATVLVGANDGMLHAFEDRSDTNGGQERFAYVPNAIAETLPELVSPEGGHLYRVDGTPTSGDLYMTNGELEGDWHTVVVGSTGAGGRAYFALDVEDPDNPVVLWERSGGNRADNGTADEGFHTLGVALGKASIVRTNSSAHPWVAIFGNGYNSRAGTAATTTADGKVADYDKPNRSRLFIVDARNGKLVRQISTLQDEAGPTGLSTPATVDHNGDKAIDAVYAGDLQGNLWRFDLSSENFEDWGVSFGGKPLFQARDSSGKAQPITAQPQVMGVKGDSDKAIVYFGTGRFFAGDDPSTLDVDESDFSNKDVQSFYGVVDPCGSSMRIEDPVSGISRQACDDDALKTLTGADRSLNRGDGLSRLRLGQTRQEKKLDADGNPTTETVSTRTLTLVDDKGSVDQGGRGFYFDFDVDVGVGGNGSERVIASVLTYYDKVLISTVVPVASGGGAGDPCTGGSNSTTGWLYVIDPWSGMYVSNDAFPAIEGDTAAGTKTDGGTGGPPARAGDWFHPSGTDDVTQVSPGGSIGRRYWRQPF